MSRNGWIIFTLALCLGQNAAAQQTERDTVRIHTKYLSEITLIGIESFCFLVQKGTAFCHGILKLLISNQDIDMDGFNIIICASNI